MAQQELNFGKPKFNFDVSRTTRRFNHIFKHTVFPIILIFKEKHEYRYFICNSHEDILTVAFTVFLQRFEEGHWYHNDEDAKIYDEDEASAISEANDSLWAFDFLERHKDHEYEDFTFVNAETV